MNISKYFSIHSRGSVETDDLLNEKLLSAEVEVSDTKAVNDRKNECLRERLQRFYICIAILTFIATTAVILAALLGRSHSSHAGYVSPTCGSTAAEALSKGCHYEPMQRSWIPHECYFSEPSEEYDPFSDREWFYDHKFTRKVNDTDLDKLRNGDDFGAFTPFFHDEHCLYAWRKMAIAVQRRLPFIDSKTADFHHSTHCSKVIAKVLYWVGTYTYNDTGIYTGSPLMFQTCVPLFYP